ncbi:hypothetical protein F4779DRAFT_179993 [Xylariaceae sp. FL0662B]|nr:hypothetical protein F4779DRAFT_179993 [Xylariaceae sp. FL0662B]
MMGRGLSRISALTIRFLEGVCTCQSHRYTRLSSSSQAVSLSGCWAYRFADQGCVEDCALCSPYFLLWTRNPMTGFTRDSDKSQERLPP